GRHEMTLWHAPDVRDPVVTRRREVEAVGAEGDIGDRVLVPDDTGDASPTPEIPDVRGAAGAACGDEPPALREGDAGQPPDALVSGEHGGERPVRHAPDPNGLTGRDGEESAPRREGHPVRSFGQ